MIACVHYALITTSMTIGASARDFLYHIVPTGLSGDLLYPLNRLAKVYPEIAALEKKKYEGRELLMEKTLPILNCRWNDVLHLSPLHPTKTKRALAEVGLRRADPTPLKFFVVPPHSLEGVQAVYFKHSKDARGSYDFLESDFTILDLARYRELPEIPEEQRLYFLKMKEEGNKPLLWARTPHVLFHGEIRVAGLEIIEW